MTSSGYSQTANEYFDRGLAKYDNKDYSGAIDPFTKAIEIEPNSALAYYSRGLSKIRFGQKENGYIDLEKAGDLGYNDAYDAIKK